MPSRKLRFFEVEVEKGVSDRKQIEDDCRHFVYMDTTRASAAG